MKTQNAFIECVILIEPTNLFCKDVKGMAIMAVPVQTYVLSTVIKSLVTYILEPAFHVSLDGQGNSAIQVYILLQTFNIDSTKVLFKQF